MADRLQNSFSDGMKGLLILGGLFFIMYFFVVLAMLLTTKILPPGARETLLISSTLQSVLLFGMPAVMTGVIVYHSLWKDKLFLRKMLPAGNYCRALFIFLVFIPGMGYIAKLNSEVHFPSEEIENTFRQWEIAAQKMTDVLLDADSFGGMLAGVLVIGIITGLCEELFFRGALQGLFVRCGMNGHLAVWCAATVFSIAHFQFYGFLPRLLLGAFFGYLLLWSRSIWLPAAMHAINNSMVVIQSWLGKYETGVTGIEGIEEQRWFIWVAMASLIATIWLMIKSRKFFTCSETVLKSE